MKVGSGKGSFAVSAMIVMAMTSIASSTPQAICVPWQPAAPTVPHYSYDGASITVKGIARGDATEFRWDFGDGDSTTWTPISNPYNLGVNHIYNGVPGQIFIATLHVKNAEGEEHQDIYRIMLHESIDLSNKAELDVRIAMAIDAGLWNLHTTLQRATYGPGTPGYGQDYAYWIDTTYGYHVAATAVDVNAFQMHGSRINGDFDVDPYVETVRLATNYLLVNTYSFPIANQPAGDPDFNTNGVGLVTNHSNALTDSRQTYIGGICLLTLASSDAPNFTVEVGGNDVYGRKLSEIVQDMVDFFAYGQVDSGLGRGGWRYYANSGNSDMSTAQWPPLGMIAAEDHMGSHVPQFVRDELEIFLDYIQSTNCDNDHGGFGYDSPGYWSNCTKAAAGIICHEFLGTPLTDPRVQSAIGFLYRHWNDTGTGWDHTKVHGNSYGMYGVMKAMRIPLPNLEFITNYDCTTNTQTAAKFDWYYTPSTQPGYEGLATYVVNTQNPDGSWADNVGSNQVFGPLCTGWRILILEPPIVIPPYAEICDCDEQEYMPGQTIRIDGSCSRHLDKKRTIVAYEWDFDYDGLTFDVDYTGIEVTIPGGYPPGTYPIALRVWDDNPDLLGGPLSSIYICEVSVHPPCHYPHAFAGGPYYGWPNVSVDFDGTESWDPDGIIVSYDWDMDNDGLFGCEDDDCFGEPCDAVGPTPQWTWPNQYAGGICLRVTDDECYGETRTDVDCTSVEIASNHDPVSDPNGPYNASPHTTITLNGSGSYDPDPGDWIVEYSWDLDNDGIFDDSTQMDPPFPVGDAPIGTVYDVCLKVTDSFGFTNTECTTIEIVEKIRRVDHTKKRQCFNLPES